MGAKTWMLVYSTSSAREALAAKPELDRQATFAFLATLFPGEKLERIEDGSMTFTSPPNSEIYAGCFRGVSVVAAKEFGGDYPSKLPAAFIDAGKGGVLHLHAMHSVVDWFAYAIWSRGELQRSLSVAPDSGILEDIGEKLLFEVPFWEGEHPVSDCEDEAEAYPLPFHPLELGEAALSEFFGYQLEGEQTNTMIDSDSIPLMRFKRQRAWWKVWK
jgi:hypothetical protein